MIKLYKDFQDFIWDFESNEVIEHMGLDPISVGTLELRNGKEVRITEEDDDDDEDVGYMVVVFEDDIVTEYMICETIDSVNKFLIKLQKQRK